MFWSNCSYKFNYICKRENISNKSKSHSFCLKVCKFELPANISQNDNEIYIVRASLFNCNSKRFFGKQWNSTKRTDYKKIDDLMKIELNETLSFHTSQIDESLIVLFEFIRYQSEEDQTSIGWSVFNIFNSTNKVVDINSSEKSEIISIEIRSGTPRALLIVNDLSENYPTVSTYQNCFIHIVFNINQSFDSCQHLVPENFLLQETDVVPGFMTTTDNRINFRNPVMIKFNDYIIENLQIVIRPSLNDFENNFKKMLNSDGLIAERNIQNRNWDSLVIVERRLRVGVHNGYTFVDGNQTVCLHACDDKVNPSRTSNTTKSDNENQNKLKVKHSIEVSLPEDSHFSVIFFLEYIISTSTNEESALKIDSLTTSSKHAYDIGWTIFEPFNDKMKSTSFQERKPFQSLLRGGSNEAPESVLVYRQETLKNVTSNSVGDTNEYNGSELKLCAMFRPKISREQEPHIDVKKQTVSYQERVLSPKSSKLEDMYNDPNVITTASKKTDIKNARIRQHQQLVSQQQQLQQSDQNPLQLSSLMLGTTSSLVSEYMANYKNIEPYIVPQNSTPSAGGCLKNMQPLQMRPHSGLVLSRTVYRNVFAAGFKDIFDCNGCNPLIIEPTDSIQNINWSLEEKDDRNCEEIIFQFIALSRYDTVGTMAHTQSVYFTLQFYRYPTIATERLQLGNCIENISNYVTCNPMILLPFNKYDQSVIKESPGTMVKYFLDPEHTDQRERYSYLEYMSQQVLYIDVWDGDTLMLLGSCAVPLKNLCRQGKPSVQIMYELDIINQNDIEEGNVSAIKGRIHLRMISIGSKSKIKPMKMTWATYSNKEFLIDASESENVKSPLRRSLPNSSRIDYTECDDLNGSVIVVRPRHVKTHDPQLITKNPRETSGDTINPVKGPLMNEDIVRGMSMDKCKKLARLRSLMATLQRDLDISVPRRNEEIKDKVTELELIQSVRERQKKATICHMLNAAVEKEIYLNTKFGCTEMFEVKIKNHYNHEMNVQIEIVDESHQLTLVTNPSELRALKALYSITTSSEDDLVTNNKQTGCSVIFMRPKESVLVPLKYVNNTLDLQNEGSYDKVPSVNSFNGFSRTNVDKMILFRTSDGKPLTIVRINVCCSPTIIDQTFRFFYPEQSYLKKIIRLPPLLVIAGPNDTMKVLVRCSDPAVRAECQQVPVGIPHDVFVRVNCGPSPEIRSFLLAIYADRFMLKPIQVWKFIIHSQKRMDVVSHQGQTAHFSLPLKDVLNSKSIKVFSSHPNELSVEKLDKNSTSELKMSLTPRQIGSRIFNVNIVDCSTGQLKLAWSICAICKEPNVSKTFQLGIPYKGGDDCKKKVAYTNPYDEEKRFFIITNRQDLVMFKNTSLEIGPKKTEYIGIIFLPVPIMRQEKIFVFINSEDGKNEETFSMLIDYIQ